VIVGFAPGGGVDTNTRVIARHLARFIPGAPRVLVQNMEGAAGYRRLQLSLSAHRGRRPDHRRAGRSWFVEGAIKVTGVRFEAAEVFLHRQSGRGELGRLRAQQHRA
jgi:hypothetical protein